MTLEIFVRYLHFLSLFIMASAMVAELVLFKPQMTRQELRRLVAMDAVYGTSVIIVVAAGLTLWFGLGKPAEFYTQNWIFHLKVGLFVVIGLLSIYPSVFFMKNRKGEPLDMIQMPKSIQSIIRLELALLFLIPLLATLMASGVGYFGS